MRIDKALQVNLQGENLHILGCTGLHPHENKIKGSKFFALLRILKDVPEQNGVKWLYVPNHFGYATFLGFEVKEFKNGTFSLKTKWAQPV